MHLAGKGLSSKPQVVQQNYLRPLMREDRLTMTNPQEPNDPQQAYRAVWARP
jgi:ATP-dependent DNA helicase RecG